MGNRISQEEPKEPEERERLNLLRETWEEEIGITTKKLKAYHLSWNKIPDIVFEKVELVELDIVGNSIQEIPSDITNLTNLVVLRFQGNNLRTFPACLGELPNLQSLSLSSNPFTEVPENLNFDKLEELFIIRTRISSPKPFSKLPSLKYLDIGLICNGFIEDDAFDGFNTLETLSIDTDFTVVNIPLSICNLNNLASLSICTNYVPRELENLKTLKELFISTSQKKIPDLPVSSYIKISHLSSLDQHLPSSLRHLIFTKLGIIMLKSALDLSQFNIPEHLKITVDTDLIITNTGDSLHFKRFTFKSNIPEPHEIVALNMSPDKTIVLDDSGNVWNIKSELKHAIQMMAPERCLSIPIPIDSEVSITGENGKIFVKRHKLNYKGYENEKLKSCYYLGHHLYVLFESGIVLEKVHVIVWKPIDIPPISKICYIDEALILLDKSNNVWVYKMGTKCGVNFDCIKPLGKSTNLNILFPEIPQIDDIYSSSSYIMLKDIEGYLWAYGTSCNTLFPGQKQFLKFTKLDYPFQVKLVYCFNSYTIFIDLEWNIWICGTNSTYFDSSAPQDLTLIDNIQNWTGNSKQKSARF